MDYFHLAKVAPLPRSGEWERIGCGPERDERGTAMRTVDIPDMEFRRHRRFVCACTVYVGGLSGERMSASDLSASGVRLQGVKALGAGESIEIEFEGYPQLVQGTIRHAVRAEGAHWYLGVEFAETQPKLLETVLSAQSGRR
jgi:hypothetical protein